MAQNLTQTQAQKQVQVQRLTQQQMLVVHLLEMPLTELEHSVAAEIDDNPALEVAGPDDIQAADDMHDDTSNADDEDDFDTVNERENASRRSTMPCRASGWTTRCLKPHSMWQATARMLTTRR